MSDSRNEQMLRAIIDDASYNTEYMQSRNEKILQSIIDELPYTDDPQSRIEELLLELKEKIEQGDSFVAPKKYWKGTQSEFEALTPSGDTLYMVTHSDQFPNSATTIYKGSQQIFPAQVAGWDWYGEDMVFPDTNASDAINNNNYSIDTGIFVNSEENVVRDWQMEFKVSFTLGLSGENVICGTSGGGTIREVYVNSSGQLTFYCAGHGDTKVNTTNINNVAVKVIRHGATADIYYNDELVKTISVTETVYDNSLGIGKYRDNNRFRGTIHYFKFKWLS